MKILSRLFHHEKKETLTAMELAELRKWSFKQAQEYRMYSESFKKSAEVPVHPDAYLLDTLELANQFTEFLLSGHFQFGKSQNHKAR